MTGQSPGELLTQVTKTLLLLHNGVKHLVSYNQKKVRIITLRQERELERRKKTQDCIKHRKATRRTIFPYV